MNTGKIIQNYGYEEDFLPLYHLFSVTTVRACYEIDASVT